MIWLILGLVWGIGFITLVMMQVIHHILMVKWQPEQVDEFYYKDNTKVFLMGLIPIVSYILAFKIWYNIFTYITTERKND